MQICYLLNFNNYYNREYKKLYNLNDYIDYVKYSWTNVNFNPGDGITTTIPVNFDGEVNYLVLTDNAIPGTVGQEVIVSRWFIIESKFTRMGQRVLTLRRDVLVDYSTMATATVYAERGYVPNTNNLIFNSEGNSYNQIKKKESILKDGSASPWLVGYLAPNVFADGDKTINVSPSVDITYDYTYATTDAMLQNNRYTSLNENNTIDLDPNLEIVDFESKRHNLVKDTWYIKYNFSYVDSEYGVNEDPIQTLYITEANNTKARIYFGDNLLGDQYRVAIQDAIKVDNEATMPSTADMVDLISKENKIARVGTVNSGFTYYKLIVTPQSETTKQVIITSG